MTSPKRALLAGAWGGLVAGFVDLATTVLFGARGFPMLRKLALAGLGLGVPILAGVLLALVFVGVGATAARVVPALRVERRRAAFTAAALAAPLIAYDAFALFAGHRAAQIPGRRAISLVLAIVGLAAVALVGRFVSEAIRLAESERRLGRAKLVTAAALVAVCLGETANVHVLPRLYPWFHTALAALTLVAGCVAARAWLATQPALANRERRPLVITVALACAVTVGLGPLLLSSASLRFAVAERTSLAGLVVRSAPLPATRPRAVAPSPTAAAEPDLPPLPEGPHRPSADVIVVSIDALRFDHVGAYGYPRKTTPNLDALAARSVRFERAYAQAPHTSFSVASMLTGKYYPTLARLAPGDPQDPVTTVLRRYGWRTAAFFPPAVFYVDADKLRSFQETQFQFEYVKFEYLDAFARLDQIAAYFDEVKPERVFMWVHLFEPHEPYEAREGYAFGNKDVDRYDSEIAYTDAAIGKLLAYLETHRPGAIVIITADHGEAFGEHDSRYHGSSLYDEQIRVPLIVHVPGVAPGVVRGQVELIDIAPTVLGLLDIPIPVRMRGTDLGPWLADARAPAERLPPAFAELEDDRMMVWAGEKLICQMLWGTCRYFDLASDPGELRELTDERPERVARLRAKLDEWLDSHVRYEPQLGRGLANPSGEAIPKAIERGRLADLSAVVDLAKLLTSDAPLPVRREAARLLVKLPKRPETKELIFAALTVTDEDVLDWVSVAAVRLGHEAARSRLRTIVARPVSGGAGTDNLQVAAALALAATGDATGVPDLAAKLDACDSVADCRLIIVTLGRLRDPRAVPALIKHLPEVQNRREMIEALGAIGDESALPALIDHVRTDEYVSNRIEAARALVRHGGLRVRLALESALEKESEPAVRDAIRAALGALREGAPALPSAR